jgi:hypothetical protein
LCQVFEASWISEAPVPVDGAEFIRRWLILDRYLLCWGLWDPDSGFPSRAPLVICREDALCGLSRRAPKGGRHDRPTKVRRDSGHGGERTAGVLFLAWIHVVREQGATKVLSGCSRVRCGLCAGLRMRTVAH